MNFFEQELRKLFGQGQAFEDPRFAGRTCMGTLGADLRVRVQFITSGLSSHYDTLKVSVLNRTDEPVDILVLSLNDLLGKKTVPGNPNFKNGIEPHIWEHDGKAEWYVYYPSATDYQAMRQAVGDYLDVFRDRQAERTPTGPKLVYICAPLRGDVEKNVEFARQKAQEVFQQGDIPICPHLMFPPIADPGDPAQDKAAREMGLRLVESCQQVDVYGPERTDGMLAEIERAGKLGIPIRTDEQTIGRAKASAPKKNTQKKEKNAHER